MPFLVFAAALIGVLLGFAPRLTRALCRKWGLVKPNFCGAVIPASLGITFLLVCCPVYAALLFAPSGGSAFLPMTAAGAYLLTTAGFGLLGLADDKWGSRTVGGFKGHIKAALRGKPTTGGAKLLGGGLCALGAAFLVRYGEAAQGAAFSLPFFGGLVIDAGIIALAANALNLLDVRPGRASFGFATLAGVAAVETVFTLANSTQVNATKAAGLLLPVVLAALRETLPDARANGMMGDTGSNLLGASAGLACVLALPLGGRIVLFAALLGLNALAERVSLSALIAKTPLLAHLDKRLGAR